MEDKLPERYRNVWKDEDMRNAADSCYQMLKSGQVTFNFPSLEKKFVEILSIADTSNKTMEEIK